MSSDQIVAMIDALYEGKSFQAKWEGSNESDTLEFLTGPDGIKIGNLQARFVFDMTDPRVAREIAGILVTWANAKEGHAFTGEQAFAAMTLFGWSDIDLKHHPVNANRAKWYTNMVSIMGNEALKRNYSDLLILAKKYAAEVAGGNEKNWHELYDIRRAADICHHEMKQRGIARQDM